MKLSESIINTVGLINMTEGNNNAITIEDEPIRREESSSSITSNPYKSFNNTMD